LPLSQPARSFFRAILDSLSIAGVDGTLALDKDNG
jgi:D-alanyl-D-alanine carboxypeptidase